MASLFIRDWRTVLAALESGGIKTTYRHWRPDGWAYQRVAEHVAARRDDAVFSYRGDGGNEGPTIHGWLRKLGIREAAYPAFDRLRQLEMRRDELVKWRTWIDDSIEGALRIEPSAGDRFPPPDAFRRDLEALAALANATVTTMDAVLTSAGEAGL